MPGFLRIYFIETENNMAIVRNTPRPCFTPPIFLHVFCFKLRCQFTSSLFRFNALWLVCFCLYKSFLLWQYRFSFTRNFSRTQLGRKTIYRPPQYTTTNSGERTVALFLGFDSLFELLYVKPTQQKCDSHEWATFLSYNERAVASHRVAVLIEHMMDAQSSVLHEQKNCSLVIRVTPMIYKQNQADSRMWDTGEGTCREMRNIRVIALDNISAYMSSKSLSNLYCKNGFTDILRRNRGRLQSRVWSTDLTELWYERLPRLLTRLEIQIHRHLR